MLLLDTCAVTEIIKSNRNAGFQRWLESVEHGELAISSITVAEMLYGIRRLPAGKRQASLMQAVGGYFATVTVLDFCRQSAAWTSDILTRLHGMGQSLSFPGTAIAGIAMHRAVPLVTRDADFAPIASDGTFSRFELIDPWS